MIGKRHEYWGQRLEAFKEMLGQIAEIRAERRGRAALGVRLGRAQGNVIGNFFQQWQAGRLVGGAPFLGSFARGTAGRTIKKSGLAELHRGETVQPAPTGGYGSQLRREAAAGSDRPIRVEVVLKDRAGALVDVIDARIDGRTAPVASREIGRRQRLVRNAPGQTRAAFA